MMTGPIVQIVWSHRRPFLFVMCLTFLALAVVIFTLPKRATVRSSIEIGSAVVNEKPEPIEPPAEVARRIPGIYGPAALLAMAKKGTSPLILSALQNPSVESIGRSVVVVSTVDPSAENEAKEFQETIADQIIKEEAARAQVLREGIAARIALAKMTSGDLQQEISAAVKEIERNSALNEELRGQIEDQRANLATLYKRTGTTEKSGERLTIEAQIRKLQEQISGQIALIGNLTQERSRLRRELAATRRLYEAQGKAIADAQFEQNSFSETRISLPPALMPAPTAATSRRLSLLLIAFAISVLAGFGTVVLLHNFSARRI